MSTVQIALGRRVLGGRWSVVMGGAFDAAVASSGVEYVLSPSFVCCPALLRARGVAVGDCFCVWRLKLEDCEVV